MKTAKTKTNPALTVLVITVGFLVVYIITKREWALYVALSIGVLGVLSGYLRKQIDFLWMKLTWVLSLIVPNILLSAIFFLILTPIAILSRIFGKKNPLSLKNAGSSMFIDKEKSYSKESFEKPW